MTKVLKTAAVDSYVRQKRKGKCTFIVVTHSDQ